MTEPWGRDVAAIVVGLAVYELWKAYTKQAPTLTQLSHASIGDDVHQQLSDTDRSVGALALIAGVAMVAFTRDVTILVLILLVFGAISVYHHAVLNRAP